jgi:hypothetical protein
MVNKFNGLCEWVRNVRNRYSSTMRCYDGTHTREPKASSMVFCGKERIKYFLHIFLCYAIS